MTVTIRIASDADLDTLTDLDKHLPLDRLADLVSVGRVMVAEVDSAIVGCLRWGLFWDEIPFMNLLWLIPESRGRGVGTRLVRAWEAAQVGEGHSSVLTSTVSAETAQVFFRRLGYVDCGVLFLTDEPAELFFRKSLAS